MTKKSMCLCENRHQIPEAIDGAIFGNSIDPLDIEGMKRIVYEKLSGTESLHLYVTGLSVALVEVVIFCYHNRITLTLYHFNRETGDYYPQKVYEPQRQVEQPDIEIKYPVV